MIGDDESLSLSTRDDSEAGGSQSQLGSPVINQPRRVRAACIPCQLSKRKCDRTRPCKRCVRKNIVMECKIRCDELGGDSSLKASAPSTRSYSSNESFASPTSLFERSGFWDQFVNGITTASINKASMWFHRYSPMYVGDMIRANTISRRTYLNFIVSIGNEATMMKVVEDMTKIASVVNPIVKMENDENGVPYQRTEYFVRSGDDLNIGSEFLDKVSQEWPDVKSESDLTSSVIVYKVGFQEFVEDTTNAINSVITIEFNHLFEESMGVSVDVFNQFLTEAVHFKTFTSNPPFWIFNVIHWDDVLDFVLYSFFNTDALMKGTFMLSCWEIEFLKQGIHNPISVNLIGHCSYEEMFTRIQYTFGFRRVSI
jgi:hypothetical protein